MKFYLVTFLALLISGHALAISEDDLAGAKELPALNDVKIIANMPDVANVGNSMRRTAVQPSGFIEFSFSSCKEMEFVADAKNVDGSTVVVVRLPQPHDCRTVAIERNYIVQFSSDFNGLAPVIVLNPIKPILR